MSGIERVGKLHPNALIDIVFVHGLGGHWKTTWQSHLNDAERPEVTKGDHIETTSVFWPEWMAESLPAAVWSLDYEANRSNWSPGMALSQHGDQALAILTANGFGKRPIFFIAHSLGGLVVKSLLQASSDDNGTANQCIAQAARGVTFFATPNSGSRLASRLSSLVGMLGPIGQFARLSELVRVLRANEPELLKLNRWYRDRVTDSTAKGLKISTQVFYETRPTLFGLLSIVDESSADPGIGGVRPIPIAADHFAICKLAQPDDWIFKSVVNFVSACVRSEPYRSARARLKTFLEPAAKPPPGSFPGEARALPEMASAPPSVPGTLFHLPIGVPRHFMGREKALAAIGTALLANEGRVAITALHGMRGVGKTSLAVAYAERHRNKYRAVGWIGAQTQSTLRDDFLRFGIRLGWVRADENEELAIEAVMERLRHEGQGFLLIFDNAIDADALKPYLPRGSAAHVLVTSNAHAWRGVAEPVEIRPWSEDIGADYLIARTGREAERAAAETLSEALGGLPLALEQAAAYCERLGISLAKYLERFEAGGLTILDDKKSAPVEYHPEYQAQHRDRLTVAGTFRLAIEGAAKLHPAAEPLILYAALLAPHPIPLFLFAEAHEKLAVASMLAGDDLDEAVAALLAFALIDRKPIEDERGALIETDAIRLHRVVREVAARRRSSESRNQLRRALVAALTAVYPSDGIENPNSWLRCSSLMPHLLLVCGNVAATAECADLLNRAGEYFHVRGAYLQARPILDRALALREKVLGRDHPDTAKSVYQLARLLHDQGKLAEARQLYERALATLETEHGTEHPDTARVLHHLARLLGDQYELVGARRLYERALAIREKILGPEHPDTARTLQNLALVLQDRGELVTAREYFERALAIMEKALGAAHPDTATSLHILGRLLRDLGELVKARPLFERAVDIQEKVLGPEHPRTAISLNNLGRLLQIQGELEEARRLNERVLAIREKVLLPEHPDTARSLQNLALVLQDQGDDLVRVQALYERALAIMEKRFGSKHPATATSLHLLACLLRDNGELGRARQLFERALEIREKARGPEHPETATSLSDLARLLSKSGHTDDAEPLFKRAIEFSERAIAKGEKTLGPGHPLTQRYCSDYARLCIDTGRYTEAMSLGQAALATHETTCGMDHPWTRESARVTADALYALGRADQAAALRARYSIERDRKNQ